MILEKCVNSAVNNYLRQESSQMLKLVDKDFCLLRMQQTEANVSPVLTQ